MRLTTLSTLSLCATLTACASPQSPEPAPRVNATASAFSEVVWEPLNPARGDASPMAGTLWGDRNGEGPTGFLLKPVDGFESPPHIHNVSYRGVVIRGVLHNDDPAADRMWMPTGSYWTQPKGDVHITAAEGTDTLAYIEIDEGPYLVRGVDQAFEAGEKPVNVDAADIAWEALDAGPIAQSFLWGDARGDGTGGMLVKVPAGESARITAGALVRGVVITGALEHRVTGSQERTALGAGGFFSADGGTTSVSCGDAECVLYLRKEGVVEVAAGLEG